MAEIQHPLTAPKSKPKAVAAAAAETKFEMPKFEMPKFEMPKFEMPKFEMPNMEVPPAFREIAEKGLAQAKENYEKMKTAAEQATDVLEDTYATASKGCSGYGLKVIETARANTNAAFDLLGELLSAKSVSEVVELTTAYMRTPVRNRDRAGQGTERARPEGGDRDRRADQGKLRQLRQSRLKRTLIA